VNTQCIYCGGMNGGRRSECDGCYLSRIRWLAGMRPRPLSRWTLWVARVRHKIRAFRARGEETGK